MKSPFISVLTATRNCAQELDITADSIRMQTYVDFEWVIQDCLSDDAIQQIVSDTSLSAVFLSEADEGIYDALNKATRRAQGDWILVLGAGDWLAGPTALEQFVKGLSPTTDIAICNVFEVTVDGVIHRRSSDHPSSKIDLLGDFSNRHHYKPFLEGMPCHQGILIKRSLMLEHPYRSDFSISADWHQLLTLVAAGYDVQMMDHFLSWYPNGGYSYQNSNRWIEDVCSIVSHFSGSPELANRYFREAFEEHSGLTRKRRAIKTLIRERL